LAGAAIAALSIVAMSSTALAGEVTGSGKHKEVKGNSPCAFSGLNDQDPAEGGAGVVIPGEVQNWPQFKSTGFVVSAPRGASDVVINFGGGDEAWGCNGHIYGQKNGPAAP
jgi:hypothetical protein